MGHRQAEQVAVGDLTVAEQAFPVHLAFVKQAVVIRNEAMGRVLRGLCQTTTTGSDRGEAVPVPDRDFSVSELARRLAQALGATASSSFDADVVLPIIPLWTRG